MSSIRYKSQQKPKKPISFNTNLCHFHFIILYLSHAMSFVVIFFLLGSVSKYIFYIMYSASTLIPTLLNYFIIS